MKNRRKQKAIKWYQSKTLWLNILALIASIVQWKYKLIIPGEIQGMILTILNIILRLDTSQAIILSGEKEDNTNGN